MSRPTIAFDLDGTLVDTAPDLIGALNYLLGRAGLEPLGMQDVRMLVGRGARVMIERGFIMRGVTLPGTAVDRNFEEFLEFYDRHIADHSKLFPGVKEALDEIANKGARLVVCTNKPEKLSVKLLDLLGLASRFEVVAGADTFPMKKPHPGHLIRTVETAGGDMENALLVGDSNVDVATARAAGVPVVALTYGYSDVPAAQLNADRVLDHFRDVPAAVSALLKF
jgi:phosphoglycolate phosphatase